MMDIYVFTLFPEMFKGVLENSMLKIAREKSSLNIHLINFREFSMMKHKNVDDSPYGGGAGMLLKPDPIYSAVESIYPGGGKIVLMTPQGKKYDQNMAEILAKEDRLAIICGHYEGYDERIRMLADNEISIGDYILTGGEIPAMVIIDSVARLIPGVLGEAESSIHDSYTNGLLEYPQYTRPRNFRGMEVPEVLISGNHKQIERWRRKESLRKTMLRRPELLEKIDFNKEDKVIIEEIKIEEKITND